MFQYVTGMENPILQQKSADFLFGHHQNGFFFGKGLGSIFNQKFYMANNFLPFLEHLKKHQF